MNINYNVDNENHNIILKNKIDFSINNLIEKYKSDKKILFVYDKNISKQKIEKFINILKKTGCDLTAFEFKGSKKNKNEKSLFFLIDTLIDKKFTKNSILVSFGGGVVGDICALASNLYYRGIIYFHIPSTITAIIDSCIGGKTAINYKGIINCIGSYYHPKSVFIFSEVINDIPRREYISGISEIIKCGLIKKGKIIKILKNNEDEIKSRKTNLLLNLCIETLKVKIFFFQKDIREKKQRLYLNFGHTFAHSIEMSTEQTFKSEIFRHGEAVAIGMLAEILYSNNGRVNDLFNCVKELLKEYSLPTKVSDLIYLKNKQKLHDAIFKNLFLDKKRINKYPRYIKIKKLGYPFIDELDDENLINTVIEKIL